MDSLALRFSILMAGAALSGCVARTALDVVTAPVKVGGKAVDMATTSQSEADEKRGRALRKREERLGKLQRSYEDHRRACERGNDEACEKARAEYEQLRDLDASTPYAY